jgi:hypothetical protein
MECGVCSWFPIDAYLYQPFPQISIKLTAATCTGRSYTRFDHPVLRLSMQLGEDYRAFHAEIRIAREVFGVGQAIKL